jgi:CDP-diglyceride synthetase
MRRIAWVLLLIFAFAIPWEYSLDLGEPLGNIARIVGLLLLLVAIPAVLQAGRLRTPGVMQWLVLAFYLWFCCTYFWTIEPLATLAKMRGYFQEMMIVWLVWEFAESAGDLRALMRAYVAGSWVLAVLTLANFATAEAVAAADSLCRRRTGPQRRGPLSRPGFSAGGAAGEQRTALAVAVAGGRLPAAGAGCRVAHGLPRRVSGGGGGAGGQRSSAGSMAIPRGFSSGRATASTSSMRLA